MSRNSRRKHQAKRKAQKRTNPVHAAAKPRLYKPPPVAAPEQQTKGHHNHAEREHSEQLSAIAKTLVTTVAMDDFQNVQELFLGQLFELQWDDFQDWCPGLNAMDMLLYDRIRDVAECVWCNKNLLYAGDESQNDAWISPYVAMAREELSELASLAAVWSLQFYTGEYQVTDTTKDLVNSFCPTLRGRHENEYKNLVLSAESGDWLVAEVVETLEFEAGGDRMAVGLAVLEAARWMRKLAINTDVFKKTLQTSV